MVERRGYIATSVLGYLVVCSKDANGSSLTFMTHSDLQGVNYS